MAEAAVQPNHPRYVIADPLVGQVQSRKAELHIQNQGPSDRSLYM